MRATSTRVRRRAGVALAVLVGLVTSSCSSPEVSAPIDTSAPQIEAASNDDPIEVNNEPAPTELVAEPSPIAEQVTPEPTTGLFTSRADLSLWEVEGFTVGVPPEWNVFTSAEDVQSALDQGIAATGLDEATAASFTRVLARNDSLLARDTGSGDNLSVIPLNGGASPIDDPEGYIAVVDAQLAALPVQGLKTESVSTTYGGSPGVLTTGAYAAAGRGYNLFQFATETEGTVYTITVTLLSGPDLPLAESIFSSFVANQ